MYLLQFNNKFFNPSTLIPVDIAKLIISISLFADNAIKTSSFTGTFSKLSFFSRLHLLKKSVRLEVEMFAILKSKYIRREVKSGAAALHSGKNIGEQI